MLLQELLGSSAATGLLNTGQTYVDCTLTTGCCVDYTLTNGACVDYMLTTCPCVDYTLTTDPCVDYTLTTGPYVDYTLTTGRYVDYTRLHKTCFVATNACLLRQIFCRDKNYLCGSFRQ